MASSTSISAAAHLCVKSYDLLHATLKNSASKDSLSISPSDCSDELGRFRIWANNIGALLDPKSAVSLDMRIKDASKIKSRIIDTLEDLLDSLNNMLEISSGQRLNRHMVSEEEGPISELEELFSSAKDCVTSLMKISVAIRSAATRDRYLRAETSAVAPLPNEWDIAHVAQKFPKINNITWLKQRLGAAITKRRQFLLYCQDHHDQMHEKPAERAPTVRATTKASTLVPERLELLTLDVESQVSAVTSYGIDDDEGETALRVPPLEHVTETFPFECPLCLGMQDLTTEQAWRKHVFRDLRPYVCTFEKCDVKLFESRHAWFNHELEHHRLQWICKSCDHVAFFSKQQFLAHIKTHLHSANPDQLAQLAKASCEPIRAFEPSCPFCEEGVLRHVHEGVQQHGSNVSMQQLRRHLGRHMEQLALFALPKSLTTMEGGSSDESMAADNKAPWEQDNTPFVRISAELIDPETLDVYQLPWIPDPKSGSGIIIKKGPNDIDENTLVEHTRRLRAARQKDPNALPPIPFGGFDVVQQYENTATAETKGLPTGQTYLRIKRAYLEPKTLDVYEIPWEVDPDNMKYVIVKQWLNEREQETVFEHTRVLRRRRRSALSASAIERRYLCKGQDCMHRTKIFPRLEHFEEHCRRRHPTEYLEDLVHRSAFDVDTRDSKEKSDAERNAPPEYQCTFWFLGCTEKFYDEQRWRVHLTNHFRPAGPPTVTECSFCGETFSWRELLEHLKIKHFDLGHQVTYGRPDFDLINYLSEKGIISKQNWKDLQGMEAEHLRVSGEVASDEHLGNISSDENEPIYCYCDGVSYGEMVACDGPRCEREWFHLDCTGLSQAPKRNEEWFCRGCQPHPGKAYDPDPGASSRQFSVSDEKFERRDLNNAEEFWASVDGNVSGSWTDVLEGNEGKETGHQGTEDNAITKHDDDTPDWPKGSSNERHQRIMTALFEEERLAEGRAISSQSTGTPTGHNDLSQTSPVDSTPLNNSQSDSSSIGGGRTAHDQAKRDGLYRYPVHNNAFGTKNDLDRHYKDTHAKDRNGNPIKSIVCPWKTCNKKFRWAENFESHVAEKHGGRYPPTDANTDHVPSSLPASHTLQPAQATEAEVRKDNTTEGSKRLGIGESPLGAFSQNSSDSDESFEKPGLSTQP